MNQRYYIAGPMRGIKDFNFPAFHEAAAYLRGLGATVFNTCEIEESKCGKGFNKSETGDLKDIKHPAWDFRVAFAWDCEYIALQADAVVCLPGWEKSKGAQAEVAIARALGLPVLEYPTLKPIINSEDIESLKRHAREYISVTPCGCDAKQSITCWRHMFEFDLDGIPVMNCRS